ncbi:MAG: helix-turn-helix transcriptional regulator [Lachnospiraceae bacterium]|nr:helix-turn-helix transcriptional regulator [Lachnospiraceae bacterium]
MIKTKELSPWEKTCMQRIRKLIEDYCEGSQQRFVEKTGLNKGSVSQYVNGKNVPSLDNANKIASAFNIDSAWIMGLDVIPPGIEESYDPEEIEEAMAMYRRIKKLSPEDRTLFQAFLDRFPSDP